MKTNSWKEKIGDWSALVYWDIDNNQYTIAYNGEHGAVISDKILNIARKKFTEAMQLAEAVKKLGIFKKNYYSEKL